MGLRAKHFHPLPGVETAIDVANDCLRWIEGRTFHCVLFVRTVQYLEDGQIRRNAWRHVWLQADDPIGLRAQISRCVDAPSARIVDADGEPLTSGRLTYGERAA